MQRRLAQNPAQMQRMAAPRAHPASLVRQAAANRRAAQLECGKVEQQIELFERRAEVDTEVLANLLRKHFDETRDLAEQRLKQICSKMSASPLAGASWSVSSVPMAQARRRYFKLYRG